MRVIFTILVFISFSIFGHDVFISDPFFKECLLANKAINTTDDDVIEVEEAVAYTGTIDISNKGIFSLTGIRFFAHITGLDCSENNLSTLDIHGLSSLTSLSCQDNNLRSLDIEGCSSLEQFDCHSNELRTLDLRTSLQFTSVNCKSNLLAEICVLETHQTTSWQKDGEATWSTACEPTSIFGTQTKEEFKIIKAYNLNGYPVPIDTKDEVIILFYENGMREKVFRITE